MITIIVVISIISKLIKQYFDARRVPSFDSSELEARIDRIETLEERVRVLEAIVTDQGYELKRKINNL